MYRIHMTYTQGLYVSGLHGQRNNRTNTGDFQSAVPQADILHFWFFRHFIGGFGR